MKFFNTLVLVLMLCVVQKGFGLDTSDISGLFTKDPTAGDIAKYATFKKVNDSLWAQSKAAAAKAQQQLDEAEAALVPIKAEYDAAKKAKNGTPSLFGYDDSKVTDADRKNYETAKAKRDAAQKNVDLAKALVKRQNQQTQEFIDADKPAGQNLVKANAALDALIKQQGLLTDFSSIDNDIKNIDQTLAYYERKLDHSLLGAYLKDKIGLLLNSDLLCQAVSHCVVSEKTNSNCASTNACLSKTNDKNLKHDLIETTLFKGTENSTRKGYYTEKLKGDPLLPDANPTPKPATGGTAK